MRSRFLSVLRFERRRNRSKRCFSNNLELSQEIIHLPKQKLRLKEWAPWLRVRATYKGVEAS
jgi:hypothetical protein